MVAAAASAPEIPSRCAGQTANEDMSPSVEFGNKHRVQKSTYYQVRFDRMRRAQATLLLGIVVVIDIAASAALFDVARLPIGDLARRSYCLADLDAV
jgi:hypothetical protein